MKKAIAVNRRIQQCTAMFSCILLLMPAGAALSENDRHRDLLALFDDWRVFESPPVVDGAPDYRAATFESRQSGFLKLRKRLDALEVAAWPIPQQVDWHLVRAEMNGYDFNRRILKPWQRDPAYYKTMWTYRSDVPAHEGPTHHAVIELWNYEFPLTADEEKRLVRELGVISPLFAQAKGNLIFAPI